MTPPAAARGARLGRGRRGGGARRPARARPTRARRARRRREAHAVRNRSGAPRRTSIDGQEPVPEAEQPGTDATLHGALRLAEDLRNLAIAVRAEVGQLDRFALPGRQRVKGLLKVFGEQEIQYLT